MMSTRVGDLDPGVIFYITRTVGMTAADLDELLTRQRGLRGVSALSADVRDLEQEALNGNTRAELAPSMFAYRAHKYIGAYAAVLEGVQAIVFTCRIGEHSPSMRRGICHGMEFVGVHLGADRNGAATGSVAQLVSTDATAVAIWVIPTDERREIVHDTFVALRSAQ